MFEKYIMIKDTKIIVGQNASTGAWYCKELPANDVEELNTKIGKVITVLNRYNKNSGGSSTPISPKNKPRVRM